MSRFLWNNKFNIFLIIALIVLLLMSSYFVANMLSTTFVLEMDGWFGVIISIVATVVLAWFIYKLSKKYALLISNLSILFGRLVDEENRENCLDQQFFVFYAIAEYFQGVRYCQLIDVDMCFIFKIKTKEGDEDRSVAFGSLYKNYLSGLRAYFKYDGEKYMLSQRGVRLYETLKDINEHPFRAVRFDILEITNVVKLNEENEIIENIYGEEINGLNKYDKNIFVFNTKGSMLHRTLLSKEAMIKKEAYYIWKDRGEPEGMDVENWNEAESIIEAVYS